MMPQTVRFITVGNLKDSYLREAAFGDTLTVHRTAVEKENVTYLIRTTRPDGATCLEAEIGLTEIDLNP